MKEETLKEEECANYSRLLNNQFLDYARSEVISNKEAHARFLSSFIEKYGPPPYGPEILEQVLNGKMVLTSKICIKFVKEYMHCPLIYIFNSLITDDLNPELIDASNKVVARALAS